MNFRALILAVSAAACLATCAHPAAPPPSQSVWKAPVCTTAPFETTGPPTGVTVTCTGSSAVSHDNLREAALFDGAKATLAARRTHLVIAREERRAGAPAVTCPEPGPDENLRVRMEQMTGGTIPSRTQQTPCKPVEAQGPGLVAAVRFLNSAEATNVPGARSAAEVLGMVVPAPAPPPAAPPAAPPERDAGSVDASAGNSYLATPSCCIK